MENLTKCTGNIGVSFIIPCYNSASTIERCINSIKACDYDNYEIIIIDDCSTDNTRDILSSLTDDERIHVFYNEKNIGAGNTRNFGIKEASLQYITFLDSDDTITRDFFKRINDAMITRLYDCVVFGINRIRDDNSLVRKMPAFYTKKIKPGEIEIKNALVYLKGSTCGKLYKTEIIKKNNIKFGDIKRDEDLIFTKEAISVCKNIIYVKDGIYNYIYNENSLMNNVSLLSRKNSSIAYRQIYDYIKSKFGDFYDKELNSIYLIEVIYSSIKTMLIQGYDADDCKTYYMRLVERYNDNDMYYNGYSFRYKALVSLFKRNMFEILTKLIHLRNVGKKKSL